MSNEDQIVAQALAIVESRLREPGVVLSSPTAVSTYVVLQLAERESEVFCVLFLDTHLRLIEFREMFHGTIDGASVYPREVVKAALALNATAVIVVHNHPSGNTEPSGADVKTTHRLRDALELVDVRVLDHVIVAGMHTTSLAERGLF